MGFVDAIEQIDMSDIPEPEKVQRRKRCAEYFFKLGCYRDSLKGNRRTRSRTKISEVTKEILEKLQRVIRKEIGMELDSYDSVQTA